MNALDFLCPDLAAPSGDFRPLLKSSMERRLRDAGAEFAERDGWLVAVSVPGEAERLARAGICDLSHHGKIEVRGEGEPVTREGVVWYQIRAGRALVVCPYLQTARLRDRLSGSFPVVVDQTGALSILAVVGPEAPAVVRRLTHLHRFPASGQLAHIPAHVLEEDGGFWIVFPQEYGHYLWEVAVDAAEPLGGGPVGADAVRSRER